jgi:hypothetical protein
VPAGPPGTVVVVPESEPAGVVGSGARRSQAVSVRTAAAASAVSVAMRRAVVGSVILDFLSLPMAAGQRRDDARQWRAPAKKRIQAVRV